MNIINWIRQTPLIWSFTTQQVGLASNLFEAPSRQQAQAAILYHIDMMFGDDLGEVMWERDEEENADVLMEYLDGKSEGAIGYLKLVNDKINTIDEIMDDFVELTEAEKARKARRIAEYKQRFMPEDSNKNYPPKNDYYNPQINRNPFDNPQFES